MLAGLSLSLQNLHGKVFSFFNDRVRAIAAGLSLEELRAMSRGEPPTERPNPRYLAHTTSFLLHIRPRYYRKASTWFTHTFRLGFFAVFFFIVEIFTGLILMVYYIPTPEGAYASILRLMSRVPLGEILRDIHRLAAEAMIIVVVLHMVRTYLTGSYKGERTFTWLTGVALLLITLGLSFSGYLLTWDQLAYWAVTIGTSMAEAVPLIGREVNLILRGAADIGSQGLLRFYLLHIVLLPLLGILLLSVHYYRVARKHSISLPAYIEEGDVAEEVKEEAVQRINFIPDLVTHEMFLISLGVLFLLGVSMFFYNAPLEHHADPRQTPLDTQAPWFFLWVQGLLKLGDKTLMGVILPVLFFALLFSVPYLDRNPYRMMHKRPIAITLALVVIIAFVVLSYMGTHHYGIEIPQATRIVQNLAPEEGIGPLRAVPFDQLVPGIYTTNNTEPSELPNELGTVFVDLEAQINEAAAQNTLPEAQAIMIVEERQANLKRVTLRIVWTDLESGERKTYERLIHLHRDRPRGD